MSRRWLEEAVRASRLRVSSQFPRDLMADAIQLKIRRVELPGLSVSTVQSWLRKLGIQHNVSAADRALHGCLVARWGWAFVFIDGTDNETERRFTLAHEIAHFVLDHLLPRARAFDVFGEQIRPVLSGERPPTREERLSAVLARVPLGMQVYLMSRGPDGAVCSWDVEESEQRADRLALEFLAPFDAAIVALDCVVGGVEDPWIREGTAAEHLAERFGLPAAAAASYTRLLLSTRRRRSLSQEIFGSR